jgi:hypothetical protein
MRLLKTILVNQFTTKSFGMKADSLSLRFSQQGQAMVELAILTVVLFAVILGGVELTTSAFQSSKASEAAKAGAQELAMAVEVTPGVLNNYLMHLANPVDRQNKFDLMKLTLNAMTGNADVPCSIVPPYFTLDSAFNLTMACSSGISQTWALTDEQEKNLFFKNGEIYCDDCVTLPNVFYSSIGDHDPTRFAKPSCSSSGPDDGLPADNKIYLYNPLPIDITNCVGAGDISQLIGILPKINRAMYSSYTKVWVSDVAGQITIVANNSAGANLWLKPPGKMCGASGGEEVCPGVGDLSGATGFYYFGVADDAAGFVFNPSVSPDFRPAFQLACDGEDWRSADYDVNGACSLGANPYTLQVHVRYRSVYESFLTFGQPELTSMIDTQYFYDPTKVGTGGKLLGVAGSELGYVGVNGFPTVKQHKDFRGCYTVDMALKANFSNRALVSACN